MNTDKSKPPPRISPTVRDLAIIGLLSALGYFISVQLNAAGRIAQWRVDNPETGQFDELLVIAVVLTLAGVAFAWRSWANSRHELAMRRQVETALRDSLERYRSTLESMLEGCQIIGFNWRYLFVNESAARQANRSREELLGHTMMAVYPGIEQSGLFAALRRSMDERTAVVVENEFSYPGGDQGWYQLDIRPVPEGIFILSIDITERKRVRAALQASEAQFRLLFNVNPQPMWLYDLETLAFLAVNEAAIQRYGYTREEFLAMTVKDIRPPEDIPRLLQAVASVSTAIDQTGVWRHRMKDGSLIEVETVSHGVTFAGRPADLVTVLDVTERRRAEFAVRRSEQRFRALIENSADAITLLAADGTTVYDSPAAPGLLGYGPEDWIGRKVFDLFHPEDVAANQRLLAEVVRQPRARASATFRVRHKDGSWRWIEAVVSNLLSEPSVRAIVVNYRDITDRKQAQAALAASEMRFRALIENSADAIALFAPDGRILYASPSTKQVMGYTPEEFVGKNAFRLIHPKDFQLVRRLLPKVLSEPQAQVRSIARLRLKDGRWRWFDGLFTNLLHDPAVQAIVGNYRDVTDSKLAEDENERQIQRLAALRAIDTAISGSPDLGLTLKVFLEQVISQLGVDAADVLLLEADSQTLVYKAGRGFRTSGFQLARPRLGEGGAGRAALERRIVGPSPEAYAKSKRTALLDGDGFVCYYGVPLIAKGEVKGVLEIFNRTPLEARPDWLEFLEALAGQAAIAIDNASLFADLQQSNTELSLAYETTLEGWSAALDLRDKETEGHTQRVTEMSLRLAQAMGLGPAELVQLRRGALLHDIGKMGVPDSILLKPGPLTEDEQVTMRKHPEVAYKMLWPIVYLRPALEIPYCHHEKWDGTGYPRGLKGEEIPLAARIFAVVDVWDALRSDRRYRAAWPATQVRDYLQSQAGTHFAPDVVEAFLKLEAA